MEIVKHADKVQFYDVLLLHSNVPGAPPTPRRQYYQLSDAAILNDPTHSLHTLLVDSRPLGSRAVLQVIGGGVSFDRLRLLTDAEADALVKAWFEYAEAAAVAAAPVK
ncbi:MAG TPA: hypothetical protein VEA38_09755 [Terriglobales bacterium]|nr:hypothetical protein [Terriglobales bacterium]